MKQRLSRYPFVDDNKTIKGFTKRFLALGITVTIIGFFLGLGFKLALIVIELF